MSVDKKLSEVLTIEKLKSFGKRICIVSGVGSGKNYWVENKLVTDGNVLLVTSRKIVKDQTLSRDFFTEDIKWDEKNFKVCTYSSLGKFVQNNTKPKSSLNETIFDYVVIDEAHALVSDATFTNEANYIWQFIKNVNVTVILMTATVNWIKEMIEEEGFKIINKLDECVNLKPNKIEVIYNKSVEEILLNATCNNKTIYMLPFASEAHQLERDFRELHDRNDVVALTSTKRDVSSEILEREEDTYNMLVEENRFPDDVNIIFTTTKLREGVNIEDDRIKFCITGCHSSVDIRQFAGRFRTGIDTLYIVDNKRQNENSVEDFEIDVSLKLLSKFDEVIKQYWKEIVVFGEFEEGDYYVEIDECKKFIDLIEKRFDLIKFNRYENKFDLYNQKIIGCQKEEEDLKRYINDTWLYLRKIFGDVDITLSSKTNQSYQLQIKRKCRALLQNYIGKPLNSEEMASLLDLLTRNGLRNSKGKEYVNLGAAISSLGYKLNWHGNKSKGIKIIE